MEVMVKAFPVGPRRPLLTRLGYEVRHSWAHQMYHTVRHGMPTGGRDATQSGFAVVWHSLADQANISYVSVVSRIHRALACQVSSKESGG